MTTWLAEPHQSWLWYMGPKSVTVYYNPHKDSWYSAAPLSSESRRRTRSTARPTFSIKNITTVDPPNHKDLIPVTVQDNANEATIMPTLHKYPMITPPSPLRQQYTTLHSILWSHNFYKRLLGPLEPLNNDEQLLADSIREGTLLACFDGSFSLITKLSSHGWVLANKTTIFCCGAGPVDGHKDLTSAYRAELGGFVTILHILNSICSFHTSDDNHWSS